MNPKRVESSGARDDVYFLRPGAQLAGYEFTPDEWSLIARLRQPTPFKELQRATGFSAERVERLLKLLRIADALVIFPAVGGAPSQRVVVRPRAESADVDLPREEPEEEAPPVDSETRELAKASWTRARDVEAATPTPEPSRGRDPLRDSSRRPVPQQIWGGPATHDTVPGSLPPPRASALPSEPRRPSPLPEAKRPSPLPQRSSVPPEAKRPSPRPERPVSESAPIVRKSPPPDRPREPPSPADAQAAAGHFERARDALKAQKFRDALEAVSRSVELDGFQAEYEALYGWLLHLTGVSSDKTDHRIDAHLIRALKLNPDCANAHYYRGLVRKRWGDDHGAEAHLRRALDLDPKLVDAARELRLYDARRERKTPRETEQGRLRRFVSSLRKGGRGDGSR